MGVSALEEEESELGVVENGLGVVVVVESGPAVEVSTLVVEVGVSGLVGEVRIPVEVVNGLVEGVESELVEVVMVVVVSGLVVEESELVVVVENTQVEVVSVLVVVVEESELVVGVMVMVMVVEVGGSFHQVNCYMGLVLVLVLVQVQEMVLELEMEMEMVWEMVMEMELG